MLKYRDFLSLSEEEIKRIVTDMLDAKEVTDIEYHRDGKDPFISCMVCTGPWLRKTEDEKEEIDFYRDRLELRDPWDNGEDALLLYEYDIGIEAFDKFKQFCIAKGIFPLLKDNPYMDEDTAVLKEFTPDWGRCENCGDKIYFLDGHKHYYCSVCGKRFAFQEWPLYKNGEHSVYREIHKKGGRDVHSA